jgi:hypothetical protein
MESKRLFMQVGNKRTDVYEFEGARLHVIKGRAEAILAICKLNGLMHRSKQRLVTRTDHVRLFFVNACSSASVRGRPGLLSPRAKLIIVKTCVY